jgi:hypothetical protein
MRTTISVDDDLLKEAKKVAADSGTTLNKLVEDSLRETLSRRQSNDRTTRRPLPTFRPSVPGTQPGVDLNDTASLLDIMQRDDAADRR